MGNASLINEMSERSSSLIDSKRCINEEMFCSGWNNVGMDFIEPPQEHLYVDATQSVGQ
jgi:hypothetical protein